MRLHLVCAAGLNIISAAAFLAGSSTVNTARGFATSTELLDSTTSIEPGSVVTIDCRLRPEGNFIPEPLFDGIVLEDHDSPQRLTFVLGEGNYLPGLHDLVSKMKVGQSVQGVSIDAGWGARNPNLQATLTFDSLASSGLDPSSIKEGVKFVLANSLECSVTSLTEDGFTIDANPPLAGASYLASVELITVESPISANLEYSPDNMSDSKYQVATFALGCFWGGELAYMREKGIVGTKVGYTQGNKADPTYKEVCSGTTGHTEAIMVAYDPTVVGYETLVHLAMDRLGENKYLLNQVGNDKGTQYRHGVYVHNDEQMKIATRVIGTYGEDCVTECLPATKFYIAEDYHQQYLLKGGQSARKGEQTAIRCYG